MLLPLKLLVVLVHEFLHGVLGLIFSAELKQIEINLLEEGHTVLGNLDSAIGFVLTASAGYLGTATLGAVFLNRSLQSKNQRSILLLFSIWLGFMTFLFSSSGSTAFFVGTIFSAGILGLCFLCRESILHWILIALGAFFIWYSFYDLLDFTRNQSTDVSILTNYMISHQWIDESSRLFTQRAIAFVWTIAIISIFLAAILASLDFHLLRHKQQEEEHSSPPNTLTEQEQLKGQAHEQTQEEEQPMRTEAEVALEIDPNQDPRLRIVPEKNSG